MGMLADELAAVLIGIRSSLVCHLVNEAFHVEVVLVEVYRTPVPDRHVRDAHGILHENILDVVGHLVEKALLHICLSTPFLMACGKNCPWIDGPASCTCHAM